jgi:molybdopterin molybdotransferase
MISSEEALKQILEGAGTPVARMASLESAAGMVLAEDVLSDIDMPPFDRSAMDGFAVAGEGHRFDLLEEITAGDARDAAVSENTAAPIMTGAQVPRGADRVVIMEDCTVSDSVLLIERIPAAGANICRQGEDIRAGQVVLELGSRLGPQHLGIAAMAGRGVLRVFQKPEISLLTTGTEVIPPTWALSPGTVRNANAPLMRSLLGLAGFPAHQWAHSADDPESLRSTAEQLLSASDVLIVAGGVSMGTKDFIPSILESLGVAIRFRNVAQKPGKPLLFGLDPDGRPVFGLPGNPVAVLVSLEEYVLPLLRRMSGFRGYRKRLFHGEMTCPYGKEPGRLHFLRVLAYRERDSWMLHMPESSGSGDLMSASVTNALALVGEEASRVIPGDRIPFHFLSSSTGEMSFA